MLKKEKTFSVFVSSYIKRHKRKLERNKNAVGTRATGECFHYFSGISQTSRVFLSFQFFRCLDCAQRFDYRALDSSQKLGGADERLFEGDEKRTCQLSFEY